MFGIDAMLDAGYDDDGRDHDNTLSRVLQVCIEVNLTLKREVSFQVFNSPFFGKIISRHAWHEIISYKTRRLDGDGPYNQKRGIASFPWNNYPSKFPPSTAEACKSVTFLTSVKAEWT